MGQAAQAHAAEAARLQAMAAQMQAGAPLPAALVGNANMIPYLLTQGPATGLGQDNSTFVIQNMGGQMGLSQMNAAGDAAPQNPPPWVGDAEDSGPTHVTQSFPEAQPESPGRPTTGLAATMSRVLGNEPVQIRTETLRSLSNNSLCRMAQEAEAEEEEQLRQLQLGGLQADPVGEQAGAWKDGVPQGWGSSHQEFGNDFDTEFHQGFQAAQGGNSLAAVSEKRSQDTPLDRPDRGGQQVEHMSMPGAANSVAGAAEALGTGITVKNTFLDFDRPMPGHALRSVRTAGGRLDLMGQMSSPSSFNE